MSWFRIEGPRKGAAILALVLGVAISAIGFDKAVAAAGAPAHGEDHADAYTFAFHDADIVVAAREVLGAAGVAYSIDPSVTGKITFRIEQHLTRDQLLAAFQAVLDANGVALVQNGGRYVVTPAAKAKDSAEVRRSDGGGFASGYEVVAVPLSYALPSEVSKALEAVSSSKSVIYSSDKLALLVLGGTGAQLKSAMETVKIFDQSAFQDSKIRWFELNQAQATTVSTELAQIIQGAGLVGVSVVPLRRLNGIIVFTRSPDALGDIAKWVTRLDIAGKESASTLWIYRPHASSADDLARTLNGVLGLQSTTQSGPANNSQAGRQGGGSSLMNLSSPLSSSSSGSASPLSSPAPASTSGATFGQTSAASDDQVRISADKSTNTLIIFSSPGRWVQIQRILSEIDRTPRQILIEASILEVTLNKDFEFGVDWSVLSHNGQVSTINNDTGTVAPSFPGFSATFLNNSIQAAVHALGSRTVVDVVSAPKIIALDNHTARLEVGDQVPVVTQSAQSIATVNAPVIDSVDYRSTGVILNVTPRVTGEDELVLDVTQEVSTVAKTLTSGIDSPTIQQRHFESTLVMHDGAVVALGGLISTNRTIIDSGLPGLQKIPVVGALFKSQSHEDDRSELIVLLTAKIIKDVPTNDAAMTDLLADMHELQSRGLLPARK
jgi:general secretion pathway protein D